MTSRLVPAAYEIDRRLAESARTDTSLRLSFDGQLFQFIKRRGS